MPDPSVTPEALDILNNPDIYSTVSLASRWLFVFFALMLLLFAFAWHFTDRRERRKRFKNLPGAGTVGELLVLSGSDELPVDTWFPVPREGVLGSVRSCDLVVPCDGVRSQHLDFSWQDGTGLLVRPRIGCEAFVDGVPVSRRGAYAGAPMTHGSLLQVGSAVLRLQLFAALADTSRPFTSQTTDPEPAPEAWPPPAQPPVQNPYAASQPWPGVPDPYYAPVPSQPPQPEQLPSEQYPPEQLPPEQVQPDQFQPEQSALEQLPGQSDQASSQPALVPRQRRKRADQWKEDWSE